MSEARDPPLIHPFLGERYALADRLSDLLAPPYDVITEEMRRCLAERDPCNIVHVILPVSDGDKYEEAARLVREWRDKEILVRDTAECVYVVRQEFRLPDGSEMVRSGVIGAVAVEPFSRGRVRPHVKTHAEPKADRLALLRATNAMFETLLLLVRDEDGELRTRIADATTAPPLARAEIEDVGITLWQVTGQAGSDLAALAGSDALYLADGHHRYGTALAYRDQNPAANRTLGTIVPLGDPGLAVLPTHRTIYGDGVDVGSVIEAARERFQIHELPATADFAGYLRGLRDRGTACVIVRKDASAISLLLKAGAKLGDLPFANEPTVASLDVARVDELVVKPLVASAGKTGRLEYSADPDWAVREVVGGNAAAAVMLNPASVDQVVAVADAGAVMPQKATYFTPKVPSGLVALSWGECGSTLSEEK